MVEAMRAEEIVAGLSLGERIELCSGRDFWHTKAIERAGVPAMMLSDGPSGLRRQEGAGDMLGLGESVAATCFPTAVTTACTWDDALLERIGAAIGAEALACGVGMVLGPGANIKRSPLCGRSFEYFSEDPLLSGRMAAAWIRGIEGTGAQACLKHFACNNQEYRRFLSDSVIDERALHEVYLASFERAVREGAPSAVMSAYNRINGTYCSSNRWLLTEMLRDAWGFDGVVVTDWGGIEDRTAAFKAGCDLCMPGGSGFGEPEALDAVQAGELPEACVNASAIRVARSLLRAQGAIAQAAEGAHAADGAPTAAGVPAPDAAHHIAFEAAVEGAVLLKNEGDLLPLAPQQVARVALIGTMAKGPRYQGAGSSKINPRHVVSPCEALPESAYAPGCDEAGEVTESSLAEAVAVARAAEVAIVFAGLPDAWESEGFDRSSLAMPAGHVRLIEAVAQANPRTVVVLMCGSVVEVSWEAEVPAILWMGLGGEAVGEAVRALITGERCPAGHLAESWPVRLEDCVCSSYYAGEHTDAHYREGLYVGYRYYATAGVPVRYPFGYGLSYTRFSYADLEVAGDGQGTVRVSCTVKNVGTRRGAEVAQLYVAPPEPRGYRPARELRGYARCELDPGEEVRVTFELTPRAVSIWDDGWRPVAGTYRVLIGPNSRDVALIGSFVVEGTVPEALTRVPAWYRTCQGVPTASDFDALMGHAVRETPPQKGRYTMANSIEQMRETSLVMRIMYRIVERTIAKDFGGKADYSNPEFRMQMASSVGASLAAMRVAGCMHSYVLEGMLAMANGHPLAGIRLMLKRPRSLSACGELVSPA